MKQHPSRTIILCAAFVFFGAFSPHGAVATSAEKPNILFIVTDDHGWGDLPANWDKTEVQMPTLDALAASGVRFTNYHTVPLCAPSRACMFTGQYSSENGMWRGPGGVPGEPGYKGIKRDVTMLSEYLAEAGYQTGGFGKWHMGSIKGEAPNDRGFDEYRGFMSGSNPYWITKKRSKPASAPEEWVNKALDRGVSFLRSDYVAVLEHMDHNIGQLVDVLDELGVAENTLIVFVSDNGGCTPRSRRS